MAEPAIDRTAEMSVSPETLFTYLLGLGDNALIHAHRLSEWSSKAPNVELDIALSNQALDLFGQTRMIFDYAGKVEGKGRDEDDIAFLRDVYDFRNVLLVEQPNGDFGHTVVRQMLYSAFAVLQYEVLAKSSDEQVAAFAAKALKELEYHFRHSGEWVVRLGDGTEESHERTQNALDELWSFTGELFECDETDAAIAAAGIGPDPSTLKAAWTDMVKPVIERATLTQPEDGWMQSGGKAGRHSEYLGYVLAELQYLQRAYPGAKW